MLNRARNVLTATTLDSLRLPPAAALAGLLAFTSAAALAEHAPHAGMMRFPDVSATHIVFSYANDLWLVPRAGGEAKPLASPPGQETFPRFSADGQTIAFVGNYDGNRDLYTIPVTGGVPQRVTHHPGGEMLCDWTPDGRLLFTSNTYDEIARISRLFTVAPTGGLPEAVPVPYGAVASISPDGTWLAYTPHTTDNRTWKRYLGGMATDIWLFNLKNYTSKQITDWPGTDSQPMWQGQTIYYISDAGPEHRLNIWAYDTVTSQRRQVTTFKDDDVRWPAMGPGAAGEGEIVLQCGTGLYLLNLKTGTPQAIKVTVPGDRPALRPQRYDASDEIQSGSISATGKRAVFGARGDVWTVPAEHGPARNLTRTNGVAERTPTWSPDGRWIAYFSDETGEYELYVMQSDGQAPPQRLTEGGRAYRYAPLWSPDSKHIVFTDKSAAIYLVDVKLEDGATVTPVEPKLIDKDEYGDIPSVAWAHDSGWLAYAKTQANQNRALWFYELKTGEKTQVTRGRFSDDDPSFDRKGDFFYYRSQRTFQGPQYEDAGATFVYVDTQELVAVPLRRDVKSPLLPKSDEETWEKDKEKDKHKDKDDGKKDKSDDEEKKGDEDKKDEKPADKVSDDESPAPETQAATQPTSKPSDEEKPAKKKDKDKVKPLKIDLAGFEERGILLPVGRGRFRNLTVNDKGQLIYVRSDADSDQPKIMLFDLGDEKREEKTVLADVGGYDLSADGKQLLVRKGRYYIVDSKPGQKTDTAVPASGLDVVVDPRAEWAQVLTEAWRIERDFFYDPHMHGVDWPAIREHYAAMLPDCTTRDDVATLIREMISELNVGHAYYAGGPSEREPAVPVGMLGCDFTREKGAYRIARICRGGTWDLDARGPLSQPGLKVQEGDYLLALNGVPVDATRDPWAALQGLANQTVALTVSDQPTLKTPAELAEQKQAEEEKEKQKSEKQKDAASTQPADAQPETAPTAEPFAGQRDVLVKTLSLGDEMDLRYRDWVERNRLYVDQATDGRVGYIHVPDTGVNGQNELFRQFYGQTDKAALIIDERWNGGGQLPHRFIELLNRPVTNYWAIRDGKPSPSPSLAHHGPKCMLINGLAGSGGDMFPYLFRQARLGKLIGTRTWGGLVGISGNPGLIDGDRVTVPTFAFYELDGTWGVEGYGVAPDIEVVADPAKMVDGSDPQLDTAIKLMQDEIQRNPYKPVPVPTYPDRKGMGWTEADK